MNTPRAYWTESLRPSSVHSMSLHVAELLSLAATFAHTHTVFIPLVANGAAGSDQTEVGPGFCDATGFPRPLHVPAANKNREQAHSQEARSDLCGPLRYR